MDPHNCFAAHLKRKKKDGLPHDIDKWAVFNGKWETWKNGRGRREEFNYFADLVSKTNSALTFLLYLTLSFAFSFSLGCSSSTSARKLTSPTPSTHPSQAHSPSTPPHNTLNKAGCTSPPSRLCRVNNASSQKGRLKTYPLCQSENVVRSWDWAVKESAQKQRK